jgi:phosphoribosylformylglycinamidine synthase
MLWEIEIRPKKSDPERDRVCEEYALLTHRRDANEVIQSSARGYLLEGYLNRKEVERLMGELLIDPLIESSRLVDLDERLGRSPNGNRSVTVLLKPGVMDPVAMSVTDAARALGIEVESVRTFRRYYLSAHASGINFSTTSSAGEALPAPVSDDPVASPPFHLTTSPLSRVLANDAIERIIEGSLSAEHLQLGAPYEFHLVVVPIRDLDGPSLERIGREGQLSLSLAEMKTIQSHFQSFGREPTDVELETLAQTWSEHCSHKTLKGRVDCDGRRYENLLKETIFEATQQIRRRLGSDDWCVSVFEDNAGVVRFDDRFNICFKVETHNHPSAIEPYGGANTGLGGVIRDPLGTGLGAKPICNTDVFCFAPPNMSPESLPSGVLHPAKVIRGVVNGVRDYGNRIGIPTVNGAVLFDERYLANPLVFCGTVGIIPVERSRKQPQAGDLVVAVGGRTGRDGIHGATFSSVELTKESEKVSGGAVQIGNAITEKKMLDVILQARDQGLYHAITDCGAGGFSSAVGEMAGDIGAVVELDKAPLKYEGLSYTEIWISEAQERMVLAVPPDNWPVLRGLLASEDVEATVIGRFEATGRLRLLYRGNSVADLDMNFLHHGRPPIVRTATWQAGGVNSLSLGSNQNAVPSDFNDVLVKILSSYSVCSKEWIVRQYDHEVQGGTVIKPLVGAQDDGPSDAAVVTPVLGSKTGLAIGCGINPRYGDLDPYWMAAAAIDEAVRNVVAVGADPSRIALLDNFCWGNTDRPEVLGSLVRAAEACRDVALAFNMPFISGKDSLRNEFHSGENLIVIPPTLLISALGRVNDIDRCVTMDLKEAGNYLYLVGVTKNELGGSHYNLVTSVDGGLPPQVDLALAPKIFARLHDAIRRGLIRACHDLNEGGLAVAVAEMAFAGEVGADVTQLHTANEADDILLFSESPTRFIVEVHPGRAAALEEIFSGLPLAKIGQTLKEPRLRIAGANGEWLIWARLLDLKEAWQRPLRW